MACGGGGGAVLQHAAVPGVDLLRARFLTHRYNRHAHETSGAKAALRALGVA
jgi:hypothetical protein